MTPLSPKPCKLCQTGEHLEMKTEADFFPEHQGHRVSCTNCESSVIVCCDNLEEAIERWNFIN